MRQVRHTLSQVDPKVFRLAMSEIGERFGLGMINCKRAIEAAVERFDGDLLAGVGYFEVRSHAISRSGGERQIEREAVSWADRRRDTPAGAALTALALLPPPKPPAEISNPARQHALDVVTDALARIGGDPERGAANMLCHRMNYGMRPFVPAVGPAEGEGPGVLAALSRARCDLLVIDVYGNGTDEPDTKVVFSPEAVTSQVITVQPDGSAACNPVEALVTFRRRDGELQQVIAIQAEGTDDGTLVTEALQWCRGTEGLEWMPDVSDVVIVARPTGSFVAYTLMLPDYQQQIADLAPLPPKLEAMLLNAMQRDARLRSVAEEHGDGVPADPGRSGPG